MLTPQYILFPTAFILLLIATISDIKTREIPNLVSYSLITISIAILAIFSLLTLNPSPLLSGFAGLSIFFIIGYSLYKTNQWGGGDTKLLTALGPVLGFTFSIKTNLFSFIINLFIVGAIIALLVCISLFIKHQNKTKRLFTKQIKSKNLQNLIPFFVIPLFLIILPILTPNPYPQLYFLLSLIILIFILTPFLLIFAKTIEKTCFHKVIPLNQLREGDWLVSKVTKNKKTIYNPLHQTLTLSAIQKIKRAGIKKLKIKEGIPFTPSFIIAFLITITYGNMLFNILLTII